MEQKNNIQLLSTNYLTIGDKEYPIRMTFRSMIDFESMTGKSISETRTTEEITKLLYCVMKAGAKAEKQEFKYNYEEFLDIIDEYPDTIGKFFTTLVGGGTKSKKAQTKEK